MKNLIWMLSALAIILSSACKKEPKCDVATIGCTINERNDSRINTEKCTCECSNYPSDLLSYHSAYDGAFKCYKFIRSDLNDSAKDEFYIFDDTTSDVKNRIFRNITLIHILREIDASSKGFSIWYPYQGQASFSVSTFEKNDPEGNGYNYSYSTAYDFYMNKPYADTLFFDKSYLVNGFDHTYWACPEAYTSNGYKVVQFGGYAVRKPTGLEWYLPLYAAGTDPLDITNGVATPYTVKHLFMPKLTL